MQPPTFYALIAKSEHLFFIMCAPSIHPVLAYEVLLKDLYQLEKINSNSPQQKGYLSFAGTALEIKELLQKVSSDIITVEKVEKVISINHEIDKIFMEQTKDFFIHVDGLPEHVEGHLEMVKEYAPNYVDFRQKFN